METLAENVSLDRVLRHLSAHLESLAEDVHEIEVLVSQELGKTRSLGTDGITRLQRLDHVRQSLEDASLLVHFASRTCEGGLPAATAMKLRLEATRNLLVGQPLQKPRNEPAGDVDLF